MKIYTLNIFYNIIIFQLINLIFKKKKNNNII